MKQVNTNVLMVLLTIAFTFFSGCGSSSDDEAVDAILYDFTKYSIPPKSVSIEVNVEKRVNEDGEMIFDSEPTLVEIENQVFSIEDDNASFTYKGETIIISVNEKDISWIGDQDFDKRVRKEVSVGMVVRSSVYDVLDNEIRDIKKEKCVILEHLDFKEVAGVVYNDVLVEKCEESYLRSAEQSGELIFSLDFTSHSYYSAEVGEEIYAISQYCMNYQGDKECQQHKFWVSSTTEI